MLTPQKALPNPLGFTARKPSFIEKITSNFFDILVMGFMFVMLFRDGHNYFWRFIGVHLFNSERLNYLIDSGKVPEITDNYNQSRIMFYNCCFCMCFRICQTWGLYYPWFDDKFPWVMIDKTQIWITAPRGAKLLKDFAYHLLLWGTMAIVALAHDMFHPWPHHVYIGKTKVTNIDHTALWSISVIGCMAGFILESIASWEYLDMKIKQQMYADGEQIPRDYMNRRTDSVIKVYNDGTWWICRLPTYFWHSVMVFFIAVATGYIWFAIFTFVLNYIYVNFFVGPKYDRYMNSLNLGKEWDDYKKVVPRFMPISLKIG